MRDWVVAESRGKVLNLFAGPTDLGLGEVRNDLDLGVTADYHLDALDCVMQWDTPRFETIILDPPYSYRKSMEFYGGRKASRFRQIKDWIPKILLPEGRVITFGYHSVVMGKSRGFDVESIAVFSHGGAIHDTIATVEILRNNVIINSNKKSGVKIKKL
jgi:hypothetical protein